MQCAVDADLRDVRNTDGLQMLLNLFDEAGDERPRCADLPHLNIGVGIVCDHLVEEVVFFSGEPGIQQGIAFMQLAQIIQLVGGAVRLLGTVVIERYRIQKVGNLLADLLQQGRKIM
ncbi:hypothetical protein D3C78_1510420 [compost metagenome]